ncbi:LysR family transcriptional regulator [Notoacmeibacter marinus]|uniref:LysR family transcriptional regulator n=1 Tax=Notoacmeibacter marinus TaxID=1876515 RepID=UPI000DF21A1D|nr:LysR family transcriptional regulator [Notoacmeibacter marinus]
MIDTRTLSYFARVTQARSISVAAAQLGITQSALSQSIINLESSIGVQLFERSRSGMVPTEAGRRLMAHARGILTSLEQAEIDIRDADTNPSGRVHIGIAIGFAPVLTAPLIAEVKRRYPRLLLSITEAATGQVSDMLTSGTIEIGISIFPQWLKFVEAIEISRDSYVFCGRTDQIEALNVKAIDPAQLGSLPMIMMSESNMQRRLVEDLVQRHGSNLNIVAEIDSAYGLKRAMLAGLGFSVFPTLALEPEHSMGGIKMLPLEGDGLERSLQVATLAHSLRQRRIKLVQDTIVDLSRDGFAMSRRQPEIQEG